MQLAQGARLHSMTRHFVGAFHGVPGARAFRRHLADADIPAYEAYGLTVTQPIDLEKMPEANRRRVLTFRRMREIMEGR